MQAPTTPRKKSVDIDLTTPPPIDLTTPTPSPKKPATEWIPSPTPWEPPVPLDLTPLDHARYLLELTSSLSAFLKNAFDTLLLQTSPHLSEAEWEEMIVAERNYFENPPDGIPKPLALQGWKLVTGLVDAYCHPISIREFDAEAVEGHIRRGVDETALSQVHYGYIGRPTGQQGSTSRLLITDPSVGLDEEGNILFWYLPDIWATETLREIIGACPLVEGFMTRNIKDPAPNSGSTKTWRVRRKYFTQGSWENLKLQPGVMDTCPAWFQVGHTAPRFKLAPSSSLVNPPHAEHVLEFLGELDPVKVLGNAALSIVHPEQYKMAMKDAYTLLEMEPEEFNHPEESIKARGQWGSLWNALHVASNRRSPLHRDQGTDCAWYDFLTTIGEPSRDPPQLSLPHIGCNFDYKSGTSMFFSGKLLLHGVTDVVDETNRLAMIWYSKTDIHKRLEERKPADPNPPAGYSIWRSPILHLPWNPRTMHTPNSGAYLAGPEREFYEGRLYRKFNF